MIKIFRRIRQSLLSEGKTGRYFKYAIGEIILVVIGILIALQVNKWNDARNLYSKEVTYLREVKNNLEFDLTHEINPALLHLQNMLRADSVFNIHIKTTDQGISPDSVRRLIWEISYDWDILFNTSGYENLISVGIDLISNDSLRSSISTLYSYDYLYIQDYQSDVDKFTTEQYKPMFYEKMYNWPTDSIEKVRRVEKWKQDEILRSKFRMLRDYVRNREFQLNAVKPKVEKLIKNIEKYID
ncbi:DUF6090 family protein [Portibacter lacus]|nr:DUF6090 family protein [Portibacter lacus]